jgi:cephalosporin-C deacetylase-like acetyl esterase
VIFESQPHFYVTALLYLPEKMKAPSPAVLVACGHSANGKVYYQLLCQRLVKQGYVVLCWDSVGQGERSQFWDASTGRSRYNLTCGEHAVLGNLAYLAGSNLARWEIWDGTRGLDYLLTRPEVDPKHINITGTSGGGFQASHIAALDSRIQVVAPSCYISALPMRMANRIFRDPDSDPEQDIFRMVEAGIDHSGLMLLIYPRPLMLAAAVEDFFPIEGTRRSFREIEVLYRRFGKEALVDKVEGYHPHSFSEENQLAVINFLNRFNGQPAISQLPTVSPIPETNLVCTRSGQVALEFPNAQAMTELIKRYYETHRPGKLPEIGQLYRDASYPGIAHWPVRAGDGGDSRHSIEWKKIRGEEFGDWQFDHYQLSHSGILRIPLIHIYSRNRRSDHLVFWIQKNGKARPEDWPALLTLLNQGLEVITFDFRGQGEDSMAFSTTGVDAASGGSGAMLQYDDPLSGVLENYIYNSMLTGRAYFLQMLEDTEIVQRFVEIRLKPAESWVCVPGDSALLARAIVATFPEIKLHADSVPGTFVWSRAILEKMEKWPIQFLLPGGAFIE